MNARMEEGFEYQSVQSLKGVGPAVAAKLEKLGIVTIQDILFHLPLRYEDRTKVVAIGALRPGQQAVIEGVIEHSEVRYSGRRGRGRSGRSLLCYLSDGTGGIVLRFFHFSASQQNALAAGVRLRCFGEARPGSGRLEMAHPEYRRLFDEDDHEVEQTLTPVYPATEGVHQALLRKLADQALAQLNGASLPDWLPLNLLKEKNFPDLAAALRAVHHPPPDVSLAAIEAGRYQPQKRLIFEELLAHQLSMQQLRRREQKDHAIPCTLPDDKLSAFVVRLGFALTSAQHKVIAEILADLGRDVPMMRLLQGDVGSGKTVVAACTVLAAVSNGLQAAVMAPTEILAEQLFANFEHWFSTDYRCVYLAGRHKGKVRESLLAAISSGKADIVIGTHALFQDEVVFHRLGAVIVDEQHRFGVHQRLALRQKGVAKNKTAKLAPHQLIMTATPIPRSLAMTAYADLDYSVIDELPRGRRPVTTVVVSELRRQEVIDRVANACKQGEQAYWVCTLVEESEALQCQAAEDTAAQLHEELADLSIGLVHGRMKQEHKEQVVSRFKNGDIDLLVATTVIEVGIDVPQASLMVIENAERLGLAQLHQLRGRVGRGEKKSTCVLMYHPPLSAKGKERLAILRETTSGFVVAQKDLQMRGPGEVLGTRQTGLVGMRIADVVRDEYMLSEIRKASVLIQQQHADCVKPLIRRWMGRSEQYITV